MTYVCKAEDDFTRELETDRKQALWLVELSNGEVVIQDDGRPGVEPPSAWLRLAMYVSTNGLSIVRMWSKFRSNKQHSLPANAEGYYFCKSALGMLNSDETYSFHLLGYLQSSRLVVQRWQVPALVLVEVAERDPSQAGDCLIRSCRATNCEPRLV